MDFIKVTLVGFTSWVLGYFQPILGVAAVFLAFFVIDFATGLLVSFSRGERFRSSKARESFFKLLIYLGTFAIILAVGVEINKVDGSEDMAEVMIVLKTVIFAAAWFEAKSNTENLKILFPRVRFIAFLDYILGVEFVKKLGWLKNYLDKEKKDDC